MKGEFSEPWKVEEIDGRSSFISDQSNHIVATAETDRGAARIVRCVNFCDGMTDADMDYFMAHMDDGDFGTQ